MNDQEEPVTKKAVEQTMFLANREMVLKLQETEQYLERNLREVREEKKKYLEKLQEVCGHDRIVEMQHVETFPYPGIDQPESCIRPEEVFCLRVCQICGRRDVRRTEDGEFICFRDDRIKHAKLERPNHSHWTVREYTDLKPLKR